MMNVTEPVDAEIIESEATEVVKEVEKISFLKWEIKMVFNDALSSIKLNDISKDNKINLIKLKIGVGKVFTELQEYEKTVVASLKNEAYNAAEKASQEKDATEEVKASFTELQKKLEKEANEICVEEYNKEVNIECEHLTEATFYQIASSFDMQMLGGYDYIYNKLVKK